MKYLVTVADDFGLSNGVNQGCIEAYKEGILKEISFMVDYPASKSGAKHLLAQNIPSVGIHLTLNNFLKTKSYLRAADYAKLLESETSKKLSRRIKEEFSKFEAIFDRVPTHINSHHSLHYHPKIIETVCEYAQKHNLYVRKATQFTDGQNIATNESDANLKLKHLGAKLTDYIFEHIEASYSQVKQAFINDFKKVKQNSLTEAFFHPGYIDKTLKQYSSLTSARKRDLQLLKDKEFKQAISDLNFKIVDFSQIK